MAITFCLSDGLRVVCRSLSYKQSRSFSKRIGPLMRVQRRRCIALCVQAPVYPHSEAVSGSTLAFGTTLLATLSGGLRVPLRTALSHPAKLQGSCTRRGPPCQQAPTPCQTNTYALAPDSRQTAVRSPLQSSYCRVRGVLVPPTCHTANRVWKACETFKIGRGKCLKY